MYTELQLNKRGDDIYVELKSNERSFARRLARIELMLEQKDEKSFEEWWEKYEASEQHFNGYLTHETTARAAWQAARGK